MDAQCEVWVLETTSRVEPAQGGGRRAVRQGGHTATMVEGKGTKPEVVVFGGEDRRGRLLDDARVLDRRRCAGSRTNEHERTRRRAEGVKAPTWPAARSGHVACCFGYGSPDVYVFGGVSGRSRRTHGRTLLPQLHDDDVAQVEPRGRRPASDQLRRVCVGRRHLAHYSGGNGGGGLADTVGLNWPTLGASERTRCRGSSGSRPARFSGEARWRRRG